MNMNHLKTRWFRLVLGVVTLFFAGIIYAWSIINLPFIKDNSLNTGIAFTTSQLNFNFTLTMCFFCMGGFVSGLLSKKVSSRTRLIISALLLAGGFALASNITADSSPSVLYIGYGVMAGTGIGVVYNVIIANTNAWFPDKAGLSSGALMMGFGFTALVLGNVMSKLFTSPHIGWSKTYLWFGIIIGVIILIASFFVKSPSPHLQFPQKRISAEGEVKNYTTKEMAKTLTFWKLFVFFILLAAVGNTAISGAKGQFEALGVNNNAVLFASLVTICNGLGRIASGAFFDALGLRKTQYLTSIIAISATSLTFLGYSLQISQIGILGLLLCGFSYGFCPTASSAFVGALFGKKHFGLNFSTLNLILIPASFVPTIFSNISPEIKFGVLTIFSIVGLIINLSIKSKGSTTNKKEV